MARRWIPVLWLTLVTSVAAGGAGQQRSAAPPLPVAGRIGGTVVGAESGTPVRFAKVRLTSSTSGGDVTVLTDESGGFVFPNLTAGTYSLKITKPGYLDTTFGQSRPGTDTAGRSIRLRELEQLDRLTVPLSHGGSIAGVIRDDRGEPSYNATVMLQRWITRNGVRTLQVVDTTVTDERGMYRFSLLPSRQYVVSAAPADDAIPEGTAGRPPFGFVPMFYPGSVSAQGAAAVALATGEDRANVDLHLPLVPLGRITGVVVDDDGRPVAGASVSLVDAAGSGEGSLRVEQTKTDGRFTFDRVVPGSYMAVASTGAPLHFRTIGSRPKVMLADANISLTFERLEVVTRNVSGFYARPDATKVEPPAKEPRGSVSADVTATGGLVSDVVMRLEPLREVSGRVVFKGTAPRPANANVQISLTSINESLGTFTARAEADGTFAVPDVPPGKYRVQAQGGGNVWTLASATAAGVETLDMLLEVARGRDVRDLTIAFAEAGAELSGQALDSSGQPAMDRLALLFPSDERLWATSERRLQSSPLSADGRYAFDSLPAGTYRLALVEGIEPDEWRDPQFLKQLLAASITITLGEGEKKTQDIRAGGR